MRLENGYWIDAAGNRWNAYHWSGEQAEKASSTLVDCKNCVDCEHCTECTDCRGCMDCCVCTGCEFCEDCDWCTGCKFCERLVGAENAAHTK